MNRRNTLGLMGASLLGTACSGYSRAQTTNSPALELDPSNPEDLHYMHRKLAYSLDDRPVYWNINALRMGFKDGILTPFWRLHVGIIYKIENLGPHNYKTHYIIKIFYTDLKTGKLLETFENPYTGETRVCEQPKLVKSASVHGLKGVQRPTPSQAQSNGSDKPGPISRNDEIGPAWVEGDDVWLNADSMLRSEPPNRLNQLVQVNDWSTYHGSMRELADPSLTSAAATHTFNDLNTFNHPWIGMEGIRAWSISRGFGRKSHSPEGLPKLWRKFAAESHPELLTDDPGFKTD